MFFEPAIGGHQLDQINLLLTRVDRYDIKPFFVVNPDFFSYYPGERREGKVSIIPISEEQIVKINSLSLIASAFYKWKILLEYVHLTGCSHVHIMHLDHFQLPLFLYQKLPFTVSGVLFNPAIHYKEMFGEKISNIGLVKYFRNRIFYRGMLTNSSVTKIFSFDPYFCKFYKKKSIGREKLAYLPDPVLVDDTCNGNMELSVQEVIQPDRSLFLMFGAVQKRKGIFKLLDAMPLLDEKTRKSITFLISGKIDISILEQIKSKITGLRRRYPDLRIVKINEYLPFDELRLLIKQCDVILAPYQNFIGSSGVLYWAAAMNKPVITQHFGLIGHWVENYKLGLTVNTRSPKEIAAAICIVVKNEKDTFIDSTLQGRFIKNNGKEIFPKKILESVVADNEK